MNRCLELGWWLLAVVVCAASAVVAEFNSITSELPDEPIRLYFASADEQVPKLQEEVRVARQGADVCLVMPKDLFRRDMLFGETLRKAEDLKARLGIISFSAKQLTRDVQLQEPDAILARIRHKMRVWKFGKAELHATKAQAHAARELQERVDYLTLDVNEILRDLLK